MRLTVKNSSRRGQALVEAALMTFVFLVLLIGILDVGQVLFVHQAIVERTRAALRYGAVRPYDPAAIRNMVLYNSPSAPGTPDHAPPGLFGMDASNVQVAREDRATNEDRIVIRITSYLFRFYTPLIAGSYKGKQMVASIPYESL